MNGVSIDTSVTAKLLFPEAHSEKAAALVADVDRLGWHIFGPLNLAAETSNVIRRRMRRVRLPLSEALAALEDFLALPIVLVGGADLFRLALQLTEQFSLSTYDAQFVALAQLLECDLWTGDELMLHAIGGRLPFVRWIGDFVALERR
jgi:predicted nucleic acid-binding protein